MNLAPIVLFVYNRPAHTLKTLNAIADNDLAIKSRLYIFSDGFKSTENNDNVLEVRNILKSEKNKNRFLDVSIHESKMNKGLKNSIIEGVSEVFKYHDDVIVLEDDLVTSTDFLKFMNINLKNYQTKPRIGAITGYNPIKEMPKSYNYDVYFSNRSSSLGWATWKKVWEKIDWKGSGYSKFRRSYKQRKLFNMAGFDRSKRLDLQMKKDAKSWSILFGFDLFLNNKLIAYPAKSKLIHIGWDGTGTHISTSGTKKFNDKIIEQKYPLKFPEEININQEMVKLQQSTFGNSSLMKIKDFLVFIKNYIV